MKIYDPLAIFPAETVPGKLESTSTSETFAVEVESPEIDAPSVARPVSELPISSETVRRRVRKKKDSRVTVDPSTKRKDRICSVCFVSTTAFHNYSDHFRRAHPDIPFKNSILRVPDRCPACSYQNRSRVMYRKHLFKHGLASKEDAFNYKCTDCGERFLYRPTLAIHRHKVHGVPLPFKCDMCGHGCSSRGALDSHKMNIHENNDSTKMCEHCGEEVLNRKYYGHVRYCRPDRKTTSKQSHLCSLCGAKYKVKTSLKAHLNREHGVGDFVKIKRKRVCSECGKHFKVGEFYFSHMFLQHGVELPGLKKYACPHCDAVFHIKEYFDSHLMIHTNNKYRCDDCGYETRFTGNLSTHRINVHKKRVKPVKT